MYSVRRRARNLSQEELKALFWSRTRQNGKCLEWIAGIAKTGYGAFRFNGHNVPTHRLAYEFTNGAIPIGLCVCHRCDNRKCVNPAHLFLGTHQDNNRDMWQKGRGARPQGEDCSNAKLTAAQVLEIRQLRASTGLSFRKIGERYGVNPNTIRFIINGRSWKHVPYIFDNR